MRECNVCTRRGCSTVDNYRRHKSPLTPEDMAKHCPSVQKPKPFTAKFLYSAIFNSCQATMEILAWANLEVREIDRYPGFKLVVRGDV